MTTSIATTARTACPSAETLHWARRAVLALAATLSVGFVQAAPLNLSTATIADLQTAMLSGALTSEKLVELYLARIDAYDQKGPKLNTVISLKARDIALAEARALDAERKAGKTRGPLHGIVVLAKDVYDPCGRNDQSLTVG